MTNPVFFEKFDGLENFGLGPDRHRFESHSHDDYSIIAITSGRKRVTIEGRAHDVAPGQIILIPPGTTHECEPIQGECWSFVSSYLSPSSVAQFMKNPAFASAPPRMKNVLDAPQLARNFVAKHARSGSNAIGLDCWDAVGKLFMSAIAPNSADPKARLSAGSRRRVALCQNVFADESRDPVELNDLAALCGVSPYQVIRDFKKVCNMTPTQYVRSERIRKAKALLAVGGSLAEIGLKTGFADQSHFTREFRRICGVTPGVYQRAARAGC